MIDFIDFRGIEVGRVLTRTSLKPCSRSAVTFLFSLTPVQRLNRVAAGGGQASAQCQRWWEYGLDLLWEPIYKGNLNPQVHLRESRQDLCLWGWEVRIPEQKWWEICGPREMAVISTWIAGSCVQCSTRTGWAWVAQQHQRKCQGVVAGESVMQGTEASTCWPNLTSREVCFLLGAQRWDVVGRKAKLIWFSDISSTAFPHRNQIYSQGRPGVYQAWLYGSRGEDLGHRSQEVSPWYCQWWERIEEEEMNHSCQNVWCSWSW